MLEHLSNRYPVTVFFFCYPSDLLPFYPFNFSPFQLHPEVDGLAGFLLDNLLLFLLGLRHLVLLLNQLVLPTVLIGLPLAHLTGIGHIPLDFLLALPL